ncbi:hypothetical protein U8C31_18325 [Sinorhizobium medicae]|uniref:hypothetical protein n=1 Tax=Sinorhizobium medicae TaxID=110321 RepID=UPI002AF6B752|nr:hypothetical protein [Sinorhizobium medicae]WQO72193.1 hypothetical protein U8C31_18325 [Sinorhizobium medicae]
MAQHRSVPCPAQSMVMPIAGIMTGLAVGAVNAHLNGVAAARQAREGYASQVLAQQVNDAVANAQEWAAYAKRLIQENEQLKAENGRLKEVASHRRGVIERLKAAA